MEKLSTTETEKLEAECLALWLLKGNETEEWNGQGCTCEIVQGNYCCKLNPY